nr:uncharacterized mitochondrial protein AtMg00810-like [Tanacetum cinerariifolium]
MACKSCDELKLENTKPKETQVKLVKFDKSANSLREMLNNQKSPSFKIGIGFNSDKASTSGNKTMSFVGSSAEKVTNGSTIKGHKSTLPGSVSRKDSEKGTEHGFSPPMYSSSDFVITRKKPIHNSSDESKKPSLIPSLKSDEWIKDGGCSKHMTGNKSLFFIYKAYDGGIVVFGSNLKGNIIGKGMVDNTLFTKKSKSHLIIVQIYVDDIIFGFTSQNLCDDLPKILHDEFEMSMMGELSFFLGLQIKQMKDRISFNQSKYIKDMLKKFGLEDSKPTKTLISTEIKFTKDDEADSMDSSKYRENPKNTHLEAITRIFRYIKGTSHLGLWYPKGTGIETVVYADSDHMGDYVDRKSTSCVCTFMVCCLTSWFAKKQTALAISTTEAEYVSTGKACQQSLWMKQALIDYGICLDNIPIMCDNKGAIN